MGLFLDDLYTCRLRLALLLVQVALPFVAQDTPPLSCAPLVGQKASLNLDIW